MSSFLLLKVEEGEGELGWTEVHMPHDDEARATCFATHCYISSLVGMGLGRLELRMRGCF